MSDNLAAKAANWVPPWQRPADEDSEADTPVQEASAAESEETGQWDRLAGAKWQNVERDEAGDEALDEELSDPQLSDCVSEEETDEPGDSAQADLAVEAGPSEDDVVADDGEEEAGSLGPAVANAGAEPADDAGGMVGALAGDYEPADDALAEDEGEDLGDRDDLGAVELLSGERDDLPADDLFVYPEGEGQGQLFVPAQRVADEKTSISEADLVPALEAILMVVDEPVGEATLAQVLEIAPERIANALLDLSARYTEEGKGFDLRRAAGGWRFYTRSEYSAYVEKFVLDGQQLRLTQASLETLAVVAYKQPVTRSRISAIRGVNCDGVVKTLITRGLIEECGTEPESGAHLYKTTNLFLEKLGLDSVEQLPPLAPFLPDDLDEVAAQ